MYYWASPNRSGGPRHTRWRGPNTTWPMLAPTSAAATDKGDPRVSERNRGREEDDGATRQWWHLHRDHRRYCVHLTRAHLVVTSIDAIVVAKGNGDDHGGARPRHGRLR